jgi:glycosyltransferase involved in cell wall biosynthesis
MIKIAHVINALSIGGAELMLLKLLAHTDRAAYAPRVFTLLSPAGPVADRIRELGIPVRELGMHRGTPNPLRLLQLSRWLRDDSPDLVQTWMYHADVVGGVAARLSSRRIPVVWNVRNSTLDRASSRPRTFRVVKACARLSRWLPDAIICCSHTASDIHAQLGYARQKLRVIPNGFDLDAFRPDGAARVALRRELAIPDHAAIVGLVGRFDPQKDHRTFLVAATRLHREMPGVHFVLCGRGVDTTNVALMRSVEAAGLRGVAHLLGERTDMPAVTAALDIAASSSAYGEAFPNAIGEAMACGVPCVVTDVGDSARIVGDTACVVPPRNASALSDAWRAVFTLSAAQRSELGRRARRRVSERFSIESIAREYEDTYRGILTRRTLARPHLPEATAASRGGIR